MLNICNQTIELCLICRHSHAWHGSISTLCSYSIYRDNVSPEPSRKISLNPPTWPIGYLQILLYGKDEKERKSESHIFTTSCANLHPRTLSRLSFGPRTRSMRSCISISSTRNTGIAGTSRTQAIGIIGATSAPRRAWGAELLYVKIIGCTCLTHGGIAGLWVGW